MLLRRTQAQSSGRDGRGGEEESSQGRATASTETGLPDGLRLRPKPAARGATVVFFVTTTLASEASAAVVLGETVKCALVTEKAFHPSGGVHDVTLARKSNQYGRPELASHLSMMCS